MYTRCLNVLVGATNPSCQNVLKSWLFLWTVACRSKRISQRLRELLAITNPVQLCKGGWGRFLCVSRQRFPPTAVLAFCVRVIICSWLTAKGFYFGFTDYGKNIKWVQLIFLYIYVLVQLHLVKVLFWNLPKCLFPLVLEAFQRGQRSSQLAALTLNTSFFVLLFSTTHRQFSGCTRTHWLSVDQVYWTNLWCTGRVLSCGMDIFHLKQQTTHSPNDLFGADRTQLVSAVNIWRILSTCAIFYDFIHSHLPKNGQVLTFTLMFFMFCFL